MKQTHKLLSAFFAAVLLGSLGVQLFVVQRADAGQVQARSMTLSTSAGSANATYTLRFTPASSYTLGSIVVEFCVEDPLPNQPCTLPGGMDISNSALGAQTGATGFSIVGGSSTQIILGRAPAVVATAPLSYELQNITNPEAANNTYYVRVYTFSSNNGSGSSIDDGGMTFAITNQATINTEVPPYLKFCVGETISGYDCSSATGNFLNFGELSRNTTRATRHQMVVATNAAYGMGITMTGNTLTSGNDIIPALLTPTGSNLGQSQFGMNLRANSNPSIGAEPVGLANNVSITPGYNTQNQYKFGNNEVIASSPGATANYRLTASYIANISASQPPGIYNTTIVYICLANF